MNMKFLQPLRKTLENLVFLGSLAAATPENQQKEYNPKENKAVYGQAELYRSKIQWVDSKPVIERNEYLLGKNILGLCHTYSGLIEILEGLKGRDREKVLEHELGHREFPMRSEEENRRKTYTEEPKIHPMVSYLG